MDFINLVAKSSYHLVIHNKRNEPIAFGSACIVQYQGRKFVLSVAHVTDINDTCACLQTNQPATPLETSMYCLGTLCYFDSYKSSHNLDTEPITFEETLDFVFCELKEEIEFLQNEWDSGIYKVEQGKKNILNLDEAEDPNTNDSYGFCGHTKPNFNGAMWRTNVKIELDLRFKILEFKLQVRKS